MTKFVEEKLRDMGLSSNSLRTDTNYCGEANIYGSKGWKYIAKILHLGSEFAIDLIKRERERRENEEFKGRVELFVDRWVHLFLNQMLTRVDEPRILYAFSVHRLAINILGESRYRTIAQKINEKLPRLFEQFREEVNRICLNS